jgi:hypothetical protein
MQRVLAYGSALGLAAPALVPAATVPTRIAWNDLGVHCMDSDYGVFSILPPHNTIHAQLARVGDLVTTPAGWTVRYEAVADAAGSINRTSQGKTQFWLHRR